MTMATRKPAQPSQLLALPEETYRDLFQLVKRADVDYVDQLVTALGKIDRALLPVAAPHPLSRQIGVGAPAIGSLLDLLEQGSEREWFDALDALAHIMFAIVEGGGVVDGSARARLKAQLKGKSGDQVALVVKALAIARDDGLLSEQLHRLADDDPGVVAAAARLLGLGAYRPAARLLAEMLSPQRMFESRAIIWALGELGDPVALPRLRQSIENGFRVPECLQAMAKIGDITVLGGIYPVLVSGPVDQRDAGYRALAVVLDKHRGDSQPLAEVFGRLTTLIDQQLHDPSLSLSSGTRFAMLLSLARMGVTLDPGKVRRHLEVAVDDRELTAVARALMGRSAGRSRPVG
jgi:HEAT repeat protein